MSSPPAHPIRRQFQNNALFLTYPHCATPMNYVLDNIKALAGDRLEFAIVAEERHDELHDDGSDDGLHLHVVFKFCTGSRYRGNIQTLDDLAGKHGNYQKVQNMHATVKYVTKGGKYVSHGIDIEAFLKQKRKREANKFATMETMLVRGLDVHEIIETLPGMALQYLDKIERFMSIADAHREKDNMLKWQPVDESKLDSQNKIVAEWINTNFGDPMPVKPFKSQQLYIYGPHNCGKSMLVRWLCKFFRCWIAPTAESWHNVYDDKSYDFCVFDEFEGIFDINSMNSFLDGSMMQLKKKQSHYMKKKNLPCIILSNSKPCEVYAKSRIPVLNAFQCRLLFIDLTNEKLDLDNYKDWVDKPAVGPEPDPVDDNLERNILALQCSEEIDGSFLEDVTQDPEIASTRMDFTQEPQWEDEWANQEAYFKAIDLMEHRKKKKCAFIEEEAKED